MDIDRKKAENLNRYGSWYPLKSCKDGTLRKVAALGNNDLYPFDADEIRDHMRERHLEWASENGNKFQKDFTWG